MGPQTTILTPNALAMEHPQTLKVMTLVTVYLPISEYDTDADIQRSFKKGPL